MTPASAPSGEEWREELETRRTTALEVVDEHEAEALVAFGETSELQLRVWDAVERAHAAASVVHDAGLDLAHRVGYGIGLATSFEWPSLAPESEPFDTGMTFCLEPGFCMVGAGIVKLEDDVVVTADGRELLSNAGRQLQVDR